MPPLGLDIMVNAHSWCYLETLPLNFKYQRVRLSLPHIPAECRRRRPLRDHYRHSTPWICPWASTWQTLLHQIKKWLNGKTGKRNIQLNYSNSNWDSMVSLWVNFVTLRHVYHCETNNKLAMFSNSISTTIEWPTNLSHLQFMPAIQPPNVPLQAESLQSSPNIRSTPPERGMMFLTSSSIDFQDCGWPLILTFSYSTLLS